MTHCMAMPMMRQKRCAAPQYIAESLRQEVHHQILTVQVI